MYGTFFANDTVASDSCSPPPTNNIHDLTKKRRTFEEPDAFYGWMKQKLSDDLIGEKVHRGSEISKEDTYNSSQG